MNQAFRRVDRIVAVGQSPLTGSHVTDSATPARCPLYQPIPCRCWQRRPNPRRCVCCWERFVRRERLPKWVQPSVGPIGSSTDVRRLRTIGNRAPCPAACLLRHHSKPTSTCLSGGRRLDRPVSVPSRLG